MWIRSSGSQAKCPIATSLLGWPPWCLLLLQASSGHTITTATTSHDNSYHNSYHKKINYWDLLMQNPRGGK